MEIIVEIRSVYGNKTIYPACEKSELFAMISGCKTLTYEVINLIKELGYTINIKPQCL